MRIAVIGGGISGLTAALLLDRRHDVTLIEAADTLGGHTHTVDVDTSAGRLAVDTGFMVFNHRTYPNFVRLLAALGISEQASDMSFSVRDERTGFEYQGSSFNGLFAQRRNLLRPSFLRMLRDVMRFCRTAKQLVDQPDDGRTIGEYVRAAGLGREFWEHYLLPMAAAVWSAKPERLAEFPAHFIVRFLDNHGILTLFDQPRWHTIPGGARRYVDAIRRRLKRPPQLASPVRGIRRGVDYVALEFASGQAAAFDAVVLATHADQTLGMLEDASMTERDILAAFPYQRNEAVLHRDRSFLPTRRRAWASWNYHVTGDARHPVSVTYYLNRLQRLACDEAILLTLNPTRPVDESTVFRRMTFHHPVYCERTIAAQRRYDEINGERRTYFCGAYWGYGFHEDGVKSGIAAARALGVESDAWIAASTKA